MTRSRLSLTFARRPSDEPALPARPFNLTCLTMAFAVAVHAPHLPLWFTGACLLVLAMRWRQRHAGHRKPPVWVKLPLVGLLLGAVIAYYGTLFGRDPGSAFAVGLLVLKTLETETRRDARVGIAFGCFALMSALLFDQSLVATLVVALGLVPALATLRAIEAPAAVPWRRELSPVLLGLLASVPLAAFAFLFVPRLQSPLWGTPNTERGTVGLSDHIAPGDLAEVLTDDTPAMRVTFDGPPPARELRYFRAYTMMSFDGQRWTLGASQFFRAGSTLEGRSTVSYHIALEPTQQRVLPMLDMPAAAPEDATLRGDRTVTAARRIDSVYNYDGSAAPEYRLDATLDPRVRQAALQLPARVGPRARELAASWAENAHGDALAIARMALSMYQEHDFRYTLAAAPLGQDRIDDFLFNTREGYCEHYASSFTFLLRAAGVPARVVTGFQGGYWNPLGHYLLVRKADAHAWTEAWIEGRGWVRFDPTAAARPERVTQGAAAAANLGDTGGLPAWVSELRDQWDVVNQWWNQAVNGFDALRQRGLLQPFGIRRADTGDLALALAIGCGSIVAVALAWALFQRRAGDGLDAWMRRLERRLARAGVARRTGEGPKHYLARASRALPAQRNALERLSELYLRARYAHDEPPPESVRAFARGVKELNTRRVVK